MPTGHLPGTTLVPSVQLVEHDDTACRSDDECVEEKLRWAAVEAGAEVENAYLCCAAQGLGTTVRAMMDRQALAQTLGLGPSKTILVAQTVGYPKE